MRVGKLFHRSFKSAFGDLELSEFILGNTELNVSVDGGGVKGDGLFVVFNRAG